MVGEDIAVFETSTSRRVERASLKLYTVRKVLMKAFKSYLNDRIWGVGALLHVLCMPCCWEAVLRPGIGVCLAS